jgi:CheY-like chemotaxis protein
MKSILLIDDDPAALQLYAELLREKTNARIISTKFPNHGIKLAETHFFDFVLVDVTMNFRGSPFGGLEVYKALLPRYGVSSLIAYSQRVTDELLKEFHYDFNFLEKGINPLRFVERITEMMNSFRRRQTCFIAMPFDAKYQNVHQAICECSRSCGYDPVRVDQKHFSDSIIKQIFDGIQKCKFVVFLATDRNPNAFYECGFAVALNKVVVTLTDRHENLPFDIRDRHAIAYATDLEAAKRLLTAKLSLLTRVDEADYNFTDT